MITLEQLLDSRDRRVQHQKQLLLAYPGCSLICLTVQLPGPVKRSSESLIIGEAGLAELLNKFGSVLRHVHVRDLETGYEAYLLVPMQAYASLSGQEVLLPDRGYTPAGTADGYRCDGRGCASLTGGHRPYAAALPAVLQ